MAGLVERLETVRACLETKSVNGAQVGIILGTGLNRVAERALIDREVPYAEISGLPPATAPGHSGKLLTGSLSGRSVAICSGRFHLYEGHNEQDVAMNIYMLRALGVKTIIITNAAGGLNPAFARGDIMIIEDHINLTGADPTTGVGETELGPRFVDLSSAYDNELGNLAELIAAEKKISAQRGIYVGVRGPALETSAERRAFRTLGGDAVGMSTVLETIAANHVGMKVLGLSNITNMATGGADQQPDTIEDVIAAAEQSSNAMADLIESILSRING